MNFFNKAAYYTMIAIVAGALFAGCQKMEQPALGEYPVDTNPPGGPLKFYAAFDGTSSSAAMNAVDSVRASFPAEIPLSFTAGINGGALQGEDKKFVKYAKPNDWAQQAKSFTIALWYKKEGQTKNSIGGNGPEHLISFPAEKDYHWSNASLLFFLEGNNTACGVKVMIVDSAKKDNWFTWENNTAIPGLLDNAWHHLAVTYDETTSTMTLYVDGVANPGTRTWANHGDINFDDTKITAMRVGGGPQSNFTTEDWLSGTFKGSLDQLRMYTSVLTAAEISELVSTKK